MAPKRNCKLNDELQKEYPFIKQLKPNDFSEVRCLHCESIFSIAHGGRRSDINGHIKTKKHLKSENAAVACSRLTTYFTSNVAGKAQLLLAAKEGVHAFHAIMHHHSFRSTDCTSQLTRKLYDKKFSCGRTKTEAIVCNVLAPAVIEELKNDLEKCNFVSLPTDTFNHKDKKIVPVMVKYFQPLDGVKVKLLELKDLPGETADLISANLFAVIEKYNLNSKIVAFGSDNTNTMMGGSKKNGTNNVLKILQTKYGSNIVGVGCVAHIVHNAAQIAVDQLPIDVESIVVKMYKYFYIYTVRVERIKHFCDFVQTEYKQVLGYSSTRWLALLPSIRRILENFGALKAFFLSEVKCPKAIKSFFEDPVSELWMKFVETQMKIFHGAVIEIENQEYSVIEVSRKIKEIYETLQERASEKFLPSNIISEIFELEEEGQISSSEFYETVSTFYRTALDYLDEWSGNLEFCNALEWISLNKIPLWEDIVKSIKLVNNSLKTDVHKIDAINETEAFDEFSKIKKFLASKIQDWKAEEEEIKNSDPKQKIARKSDAKKWTELFQHFTSTLITCPNFKLIIEYAMSLPATNADVERVFSIMNALWSDDKSQMKVETVKCIMLLRTNVKDSCSEYYDKLVKNTALCKKIHGSSKYE